MRSFVDDLYKPLAGERISLTPNTQRLLVFLGVVVRDARRRRARQERMALRKVAMLPPRFAGIAGALGGFVGADARRASRGVAVPMQETVMRFGLRQDGRSRREDSAGEGAKQAESGKAVRFFHENISIAV